MNHTPKTSLITSQMMLDHYRIYNHSQARSALSVQIATRVFSQSIGIPNSSTQANPCIKIYRRMVDYFHAPSKLPASKMSPLQSSPLLGLIV